MVRILQRRLWPKAQLVERSTGDWRVSNLSLSTDRVIWKTFLDIPEKCWLGCKESNLTNIAKEVTDHLYDIAVKGFSESV